MTLAIIGSRDFLDLPLMREKAAEVIRANPTISLIVSGGQRGADTLSEYIANEHKLNHRHYHADWKAHGRAAGPMRNKRIIAACDIVLAFPLGESKGTRGAIKLAYAARKKVHTVES